MGRRPDNYHELSTVFQTVTLHDELSFILSDDEKLNLTSNAHDVPLDESNLILRAARLLCERFRVRKGAKIHLTKRIPAGGGLGGGSSNAAVTLLALALLWDIELEREDFVELGKRIGADVPFFFTGGTALGTGLGTEITALEDVRVDHLLVVTPCVRVSTAEAYKSLNARALTLTESAAILSVSRATAQFHDSLPEALHNDFEPVVFGLEPEIARAKESLMKRGALAALLSGSGSSVFGIFENAEAKLLAQESLKNEPGWQIFSCATLAREEYLMALGECAGPLIELRP
ncbi:MAG: 4-(cytidine 5'-diphospho)-2-C-methyl-D-erythritol kinase [Acidobacteria bacterium 13_1_20CM_3_53_8]|nr:MAG: 4-(cytidine 5'-diphospho)-2-C-methyl-D-erythritol kinase [Acidobacteria bacterium 13_1_20CM_3_53_8]